jgi:hypothetical protein
MSTKQASRVLITLFCPSQPIYASNNDNDNGNNNNNNNFNNENTENCNYNSNNNNFDSKSPKISKTSELLTNNEIDFNISNNLIPIPDATSIPRNYIDINKKNLKSKINNEKNDNFLPKIKKNVFSNFNFSHENKFLSQLLINKHGTPWMFSYYHKSGGLKDSFVTYLHFDSYGCIKGN